MIDWTKYVTATYLRVDHLHGDTVAEIRRVIEEQLPRNPPEIRPVAYFSNLPQALPLNQTNLGSLRQAFGDNEGLWVGKRILLNIREERVRGALTKVIRITAPAPNN